MKYKVTQKHKHKSLLNVMELDWDHYSNVTHHLSLLITSASSPAS